MPVYWEIHGVGFPRPLVPEKADNRANCCGAQ
jgi:hypothetical protein